MKRIRHSQCIAYATLTTIRDETVYNNLSLKQLYWAATIFPYMASVLVGSSIVINLACNNCFHNLGKINIFQLTKPFLFPLTYLVVKSFFSKEYNESYIYIMMYNF